MAEYSATPISFFMAMSLPEFFDWMGIINGEIKRKNDEFKKATKAKK